MLEFIPIKPPDFFLFSEAYEVVLDGKTCGMLSLNYECVISGIFGWQLWDDRYSRKDDEVVIFEGIQCKRTAFRAAMEHFNVR